MSDGMVTGMGRILKTVVGLLLVGGFVVECGGGGKIPWEPTTPDLFPGEIFEVLTDIEFDLVYPDDIAPPPACQDDDQCNGWAKSEFGECWQISCDLETGYCKADPHALDGEPCDDESMCTLEDECLAGECGSDLLFDCSDGIDCTVDMCDPILGCSSGPDDDLCDDGIDCTLDNCDPTLGCENLGDSSKCDDALYCNGIESCDPLEGCVPGTSAPVDDGVACTVDLCDEETHEITHTADDALCDNGLFCDGAETCSAETDCMAGPSPVDDGIDCTVDECDEDTDLVSHTADNSSCDDGACVIG